MKIVMLYTPHSKTIQIYRTRNNITVIKQYLTRLVIPGLMMNTLVPYKAPSFSRIVIDSTFYGFRDWSLIMGRGGLQNGKIAGP